MVGEICLASARGARCRAGAPIPTASRRAMSARPTRRRWCCSPTPSAVISSRRIFPPRSRCWRRRAAACICQGRLAAARVRSVAGAPSLRSGWWTRRGSEAERTVAALAPFAARGIPVVGLEPSCVLGFRDEIPALVKSEAARTLAGQAMLFEEYLARDAGAGAFKPPLKAWPSARCCTATATRRRSAPWARSKRAQART